ncbi:twin-arginine translocase subunit TatB [Limnohabitans sp. TS-CS-82]|uniref:Sec-independent protein translocase protein TatB n=1 Tax=Limnohabitans sp. TS-CS-82 TaxID=2094193 RepID=UPI000CF2DA72|nr:Sec-independent protein translocase protein TatB [Limnohabitans sp. TS-CS-82]PQA82097.1 twin-arginine translocase subunit TatB [Limnohabitans sp. TS-CS-82]
MIDLGISKIALIGAVALIVIGPEKLPGVARTIGTLIGKAQRYVADVKAEVNRSMELDELKKMKETMETAARDVEQSVHTASSDFEKDWAETTAGISSDGYTQAAFLPPVPQYQHPKKKWRLKRGSTPHWYKVQNGVRTKAQSSAARVARFRPVVKRSVDV